MTDRKKIEGRGVDPAWLMTKKLGISLAEAHARLAQANADIQPGAGADVEDETSPAEKQEPAKTSITPPNK